MLALDENPPMIPQGVQTLSELPGPWWVAHTRARSEKAFAWDLLAQGISFFLPMLPRTMIWGKRRRTILLPLFPSYVFFSGSPEDRYSALRTNRLAQVIPVVQTSRFVSELEAIRIALASGVPLDPYPQLAVGKRCRIAYGPLMGIEGIVIQKNAITRMVLQVSLLGQATSLEIGPEYLEPLI